MTQATTSLHFEVAEARSKWPSYRGGRATSRAGYVAEVAGTFAVTPGHVPAGCHTLQKLVRS